MKKQRINWLKFSDVCFMKFVVVDFNRVHVKGPQGLSSYIDNDMSIEDARAFYKRKLEDGYKAISINDAPSECLHSALTYGD